MRALNGSETGYDDSVQNRTSQAGSDVSSILKHHSLDNPALDLANRSLSTVPPSLFTLPHIQHLYLEGNKLAELPQNFFDRLPALQWLDLRNNQLLSLPSSIGHHQCLKNLLLGGNQITHLPLQMGLARSITGLNIGDNPIQFPPQHIVSQGVNVILSYLYQELQSRSAHNSREQEDQAAEADKLNVADDEDSQSVSDHEIFTDSRNIPSPMSDDFQLMRPAQTPITASLNRPLNDYKNRFHGLSEKSPLSLYNRHRNSKQEISLQDIQQEQEETRKEQLRNLKERQHSNAEQRKKDVKVLEEWRTETRERQSSGKRSVSTPDTRPPPFGIDVRLNIRGEEGRKEQKSPNPSKRKGPLKHSQEIKDEVKMRIASTSRDRRRPLDHVLVEIPNYISETRREEYKKREASQKDEGDSKLQKAIKPLRPPSTPKDAEVLERMKKHSLQMLRRLQKQRERAEHREEKSDEAPQKNWNPHLEYRFKAFTGDVHTPPSD